MKKLPSAVLAELLLSSDGREGNGMCRVASAERTTLKPDIFLLSHKNE